MNGAVVAIAGAIRWLVVLAMIRLSAVAVAVAERCQLRPHAGLALVDISERCGRLARRMLRE
jgi:hypothetical protein